MKKTAASTLAVLLAVVCSAPVAGSQLLNISTRLNVGKGENVLIGGFIIDGTQSKKVIVRGIVPSLSDFDVILALGDPVLELHQPGGAIVTNDNWRDAQEQEIIDAALEPTCELDSAIIAALDPGLYTVIVRSKDDSNPEGTFFGDALVEAYDLNQAANSRLEFRSSKWTPKC